MCVSVCDASKGQRTHTQKKKTPPLLPCVLSVEEASDADCPEYEELSNPGLLFVSKSLCVHVASGDISARGMGQLCNVYRVWPQC